MSGDKLLTSPNSFAEGLSLGQEGGLKDQLQVLCITYEA